jgi:hypothetical protein
MENQTMSSHLVTGVFNDKNSADRAYTALQNQGYSASDIHLAMSADTREKHFSHEVVKTELGSKAMEGAGTGSAIGGTVVAIAAAVAAIGSSLIIPGLGLVVAGPLAAALAGAGAGGVTGGIVGALIGSGIPKERAVIYEKSINDGNIVMGVHVPSTAAAETVADELRQHNATEIHS